MRDSENNPNILQALWLRLKRVGSSIATYKPGIFVQVLAVLPLCWLFYLYSYPIWSPKLESLDPDVRKSGYIQAFTYTFGPVLAWQVKRLLDRLPNPLERFAKRLERFLKRRKTKGSQPK
ncbi:hypothetical protein AB9F26_04930 [Falsihalocynthiibacter sp. BN13B15]|uniref:hypothetical protein n=1 Tax=Falsihalocynthiibacter sp. BN13B15 TaxID=3240871 RepID=UPI00350F399B